MAEHVSQTLDFDAYKPAQIAARIEEAGIAKVRLDFLTTLMLAVLAGAYIGFGALLYTIAITGSELGWGPTRLLGGLAFSLGLILVIIAGAELFTGNALVVMAWADRKISARELLRNWAIVYVGNFIGRIRPVCDGGKSACRQRRQHHRRRSAGGARLLVDLRPQRLTACCTSGRLYKGSA